MNKSKPYYLAGPMSGIPQFNYPAFRAAAEKLRKQGFKIQSPAEMDSPEMQELAMASKTGNFSDLREAGESWGEILARDVKLVADDVAGIFVLKGWELSKGCNLELFVACLCGKPVYELGPRYGVPSYASDPHWLLQDIALFTADNEFRINKEVA